MIETGLTVDITKIDADRGFFDEFERPSKEQWKAEATAALKGAPFDKVMYTKTYENITIEPIYCAEDIEGLPHLKSRPGFAPFVRSTRASGYLGEPWKICQELSEGIPEDFNEEAKFDLARGQTALHIVLDRPTRLGLDPAVAVSEEIGARGLSLASLADLKTAIAGIDPQKTALLCYTGAIALPLVALLAAAVGDDGDHLDALDACIGCDPLAELASEGRIAMSIDAAYDCMAQTITWANQNAAKLQTVFIQGHPYHNAGASSNEEVALALATAAEYLREMISRGLSIDDVAPQIRFGFSLGSNFFMEIAKLRAARILWSQLVAAFGGSDKAQKMSIHGRSSAFNKTVFDPYVNMLRITSEGMSGAIGGVDSLHLAPFDEPQRTPDRFSRRIARNVQVMLQEEARFTRPIDVGGGSYYIEKMTNDFAASAWAIFQDIEKQGGMAAAIAAGRPQAMCAATAAKRARNIQQRSDVILGTNMYANLAEKKIEIPTIDHEAIKKSRTAAVAAYRRKNQRYTLGDQLCAIEEGLSKLAFPAVAQAIEAIRSGATLGELWELAAPSAAAAVTPLAITRSAKDFEALRMRVEATQRSSGKKFQIFLATMGPIPQHKPRADFSAGFFEVAGFEMLWNNGFETADAAAEAALASQAPVVVICSTDATYPDYVPTLAARIKGVRPETTVIVAGKQAPEVEQSFIAAGVDDFIHVRSNCYEFNKKLFDKYTEAK
jgi:methylmalonyl-CoA mutase